MSKQDERNPNYTKIEIVRCADDTTRGVVKIGGVVVSDATDIYALAKRIYEIANQAEEDGRKR